MKPKLAKKGAWATLLSSVLVALPVLAIGAGGPRDPSGGGGPGATPAGCGAAPTGEMAAVLATIRTIESGNNYEAKAKGSSASGAYQFTNPTWNDYGGYPTAMSAPPAVQDAKATEHAQAILDANGGDVSLIPVVWYIGHVPNGAEWDTVPVPGAGNVLTPREYQAKWLGEYDKHSASGGGEGSAGSTVGCGYEIPAGATQLRAREISWGGYSNGHIPYEAMRYSEHSGYMYPPASEAWDALWAAADADGLNVDGWSYRSFEDQAALDQGDNPFAAAPGGSNHGWGLAIDVEVLAPGPRGANHPGYQRAEYLWLKQNASRWGFCHPDWADPNTGDGPFEPWHFEWCAFMGPAGGYGHGA